MKRKFPAINFITSLVILLLLCGCASFDIIGNASSKVLARHKPKYTKIIEKDRPYCYNKTLEAIRKWSAHDVQTRENRYIIAMNFCNIFKSCIDTTELGVFFKKKGPDKTEVRVSSLNHNLAEYVSGKLFEYLAK